MRRLWQVLLFLLAGCTVGPRYEQPPEMDLPEQWHQEVTPDMPQANTECFVWWKSINDPTLHSLIERAARQNLDLYIAGTRILEARRLAKGKTGDCLPHVDASITTGHLYYSKDALIHGILANCCGDKHHVHRNVNFFEVGFDVNWEIDLFDRTKHEINAMKAKTEATEESLRDTWITLSAEIAKVYVELRSMQQRQQLLAENIEIQQEIIKITRDLLAIGDVDETSVLQAEAQLEGLFAQKPIFELAIHKAIHRLSILLGYAPGELYAELCDLHALPLLPSDKPIGLPSELLRKRPDIRRAERELAAATEMTGSAVAALFPRLSLVGFIGAISTHLKSLTSGSSGVWFAAPQLLMPIFNSQLLQQDVDLSKIQTQRALFEYQKTVLEALEEVENAIASYRTEIERNSALERSQQISQEVHSLTQQLYDRGVKEYLEVQAAKRAVNQAQDTAIQSQAELLIHYISLYKAFGGGWVIPSCEEENAPGECVTGSA